MNISKLKVGTDTYSIKDSSANEQIEELRDILNKQEYEVIRTKYIAHRGAFYNAPENTIASFEKAGELGYTLVEGDVFFSSNGIPYVFHDTTVDRMTNGTGAIQSKTSTQINSLLIDSGSNITKYPNLRIPTLSDFLDICIKWGMKPIIEVKGTVTVANTLALVNMVKDKGLENVAVITSMTLSHITQVRNINKSITVEYCPATYSASAITTCVNFGNCMLGLVYSQVTKAIVDSCRASGVKVNAYTVNDYDISRNLEKMGVYSVYSDTII